MNLEERVQKGLRALTTTSALKTRQALYGLRHTAHAYQDLYHATLLSAGRKTQSLQTKIFECIADAYTSLTADTETPDAAKLHWQDARQNAQAKRERTLEMLRTEYDTEPASDLLVSAFASLPAYYGSGIPSAFVIGHATNKIALDPSTRDSLVAWGTFGAQIAIGYGIFAYAYAKQQPTEFTADGSESGKIQAAKVAKYAAKTILSLSPIELAYGLGKAPLHEAYMRAGMGKETGSILADATMLPVWYAAVFIPAAFMFGLTQNKHSPKSTS